MKQNKKSLCYPFDFQSRAIPLSIIAPSADWKSGSGLNVLLSNILWQPCMLVLQGSCVTAAFEHAPFKRLLNRNDKETWQALKMNLVHRYNCVSPLSHRYAIWTPLYRCKSERSHGESRLGPSQKLQLKAETQPCFDYAPREGARW